MSTVATVTSVFSLLLVVLHFSLLSRISKWTFDTQRKLDETNKLLAQMAGRQ